jgi:exodeoxyribonuclease-5
MHGRPVTLSTRQASETTKIPERTVAKRFNRLVELGRLILVKKETWRTTGRKGSKYELPEFASTQANDMAAQQRSQPTRAGATRPTSFSTKGGEMKTLTFSRDQQKALDAVMDWRAGSPRGDNQYTILGGLAGSGKTTLIAYLSSVWPNTAVAALCGKAAHVLRFKGVDATTIHSLIYLPFEDDEGKIRFRRRRNLEGVETLIIDEASMIDNYLFSDLLSFKLPILFVGDHGQLEPIGPNPGLMAHPNLRLEKIHRQAANSPILKLATAFRKGKPVKYGKDSRGKLQVLGKDDFDRMVSPDYQIIVGFNKTRHEVNARAREMLGHKTLVAPGDKLICLRNNRNLGVFNGQQLTVREVAREAQDTIELAVETDDGGTIVLPAWRDQFGQNLIEDFRSHDVALFDYGYAITAHKAQGSEWDNVLVLEEIDSRWDARRWRYTVATRAKERLIYCM